MNKTNQNAFLEHEPIGKLMMKYAVPCVISLLVGALYNIVDQIFIANATYLGSFGNAANTVVFPMTVIALAISVMIGDGSCAFVSISLGAREHEKAHKTIGNAVWLAIASSVVLTVIYFVFQDPILTIFGGRVNEQTFAFSKEYFTYITIGIPFYMFGQAMNPVIRSDGNPKFAMIATLSGALLNVILDPVMIFLFHWGMMGAAVATVLGQFLTAVLSAGYLFRMRAVKLQKNSFVLNGQLIKKFIPLGLCSFLSQISLVAAMAAINNMIQKYGALDSIFGQAQYAQVPMAVIGIVMKFFQIVISIVIGMAAGCIPIVGYNIGAGRKDRAKELFTKLLIAETAVGVIALLIVELLPLQLISIFGAANESAYYTTFALKSFRIYLCMIIFACINKASFIYLQSLGKPWASTMLSMLREVVFGVGFALLLPIWFGLDGVLYSMPVSDILTFIASVIVIIITYRELSSTQERAVEEPELLDEPDRLGVSGSDVIITIGRSFGAGGRTIGKRLAEALNIPYYDKELIEQAAAESGLSKEYLSSFDENSEPGNVAYDYRGAADLGESEVYEPLGTLAIQAQNNAIEQAANAGSCVIVGRRADRILRNRDNILRVFITAPLEKRAKRVSDREGLSLKESEQKIKRVDHERAAYYNQLSENKWGEPETYDVCINTCALDVGNAVSSILGIVRSTGALS